MSEQHTNSEAATFVTVLAWVLIVYTGFGVVASLMQNAMVSLVIPALSLEMSEGEPRAHGFLTGIRVIAASILCLVSFLLFASWSLLKRRNWARKTFVVVFVLGIVWSGVALLGLAFGVGVFNLLPSPPGSPEFPPGALTGIRVMIAMSAIVVAGLGLLFFWLVRRLRAPDVRAEFVVAQPTATP
jgi:hypothetical protein